MNTVSLGYNSRLLRDIEFWNVDEEPNLQKVILKEGAPFHSDIIEQC